MKNVLVNISKLDNRLILRLYAQIVDLNGISHKFHGVVSKLPVHIPDASCTIGQCIISTKVCTFWLPKFGELNHVIVEFMCLLGIELTRTENILMPKC